MTTRVRHPRVLRCFRFALYAATAVVITALAVATVGYVGFLALVGGFALLLSSSVDPAVFLGLAAVAVGVVTTSAACLVFGARWVDARVTAAATEPDPLDVLKARYVRAELDERSFERAVERLLLAEAGRDASDDVSLSRDAPPTLGRRQVTELAAGDS